MYILTTNLLPPPIYPNEAITQRSSRYLDPVHLITHERHSFVEPVHSS